MSCHSHNTSRHILIATRNRNTSIVELRTSDGLNTVCNNLSCLQAKPHAFSAHSNSVAHAHGVVLPRQHLLLFNSSLDLLSNIQQVRVARVALPPHARYADLWVVFENVLVWHAGCVQHCLRGWEVMLAGQGGGIFVQTAAGFRIGEIEVTGFFGYSLLFEVGGIHYDCGGVSC